MSKINAGEGNLRAFEVLASRIPGVLVLNTFLGPVACNKEALQILAFPDDTKGLKHLTSFLASQVQSKLVTRSSIERRRFVRQFKSGRRTYQCRALNLHQIGKGTEMAETIALLLERQPPTLLSLKRRTWDEFKLTQRERQTIELLLKGMTNKEIALSMNISPTTVKTYLRQIMTKMRVPTRAAIVGKILVT